MISQIVDVLKEKMLKTMDVLVGELGSVRVGRANPNMLDRVEVEYYGVMTRLNQLANISTPESRIRFRINAKQRWIINKINYS